MKNMHITMKEILKKLIKIKLVKYNLTSNGMFSNRYKYLCGAMPAGIFLMQWYDPLNKFMLLKHFDCVLPSPLNVFKMVITPEMEYPMVCVSVKQPYQQNKLKLDLINMNSGASWFHSDELEDMDGSGILMLYASDNNNLSTIFIFVFKDIRKFDLYNQENASFLL